MENGTQSPSCQSHYLWSNTIMRSTTKRCSLSFEPYKSGGTSSKALNTSLRYGWTAKTLSTSWQQNSSIKDKPGGCSTSRNLTSSFITDQGNPWESQTHCLKGLTMGLAAMTTPMLSSFLRSSSQYALLKVWNSLVHQENVS